MVILDTIRVVLSRATDDNTHDHAGNHKVLLGFYFFFQLLGGHILMPLLVGTFMFSRARRDITLVNLCTTFIITAICSCLLLYTGEFQGPEPDKVLCMFQSAAVDASPPMWVTALLAFVYHMWRVVDPNSTWRPFTVYQKAIVIIAPYFVFLVFCIANIAITSQTPEILKRSERQLYCDTSAKVMPRVSAAYTCILDLVAVALTFHLGIRLYKSIHCMRRAGTPGIHDMGLTIRIMTFGAYILAGLVFGIASAFVNADATPRDIYISTLSLAVFAIFGTQRDVIRVWMFWRRQGTAAVSTEHSDVYSTSVIDADGTNKPGAAPA
ncbi:hypothetical protein BC834DRAFT_400412 [Gloeopeniophorella convolvens]|nr:hypothetical protein BC834DRAFT_400412 [Gloeopeniophorella convolvens]